MFGLKIRSWMENHIVRPRKKGNKNKNGASGNLVTSISTQNGHKGSSSQGDGTIASPARRSEVSPIQYHTTSRAGWHTPDDDKVSPKPSDQHQLHPFHNKMVKSLTTSPKSIFRKANTLETHVTTHSNNYSRSVDSNQYNQPHRPMEVRTLKQSDFTPMTTTTPTPQTVTTKSQQQYSTQTKYNSTTLPNHSQTLNYCSTTTTTSSSSSEMLEQRTVNRYEYPNHIYKNSVYDTNNMRNMGATTTITTNTTQTLNGNGPYQMNQNQATSTATTVAASLANMPKYENTYQYTTTNKNSNNQVYGDASNMHSLQHHDLMVNGGGKCLPKQSNGIQINRCLTNNVGAVVDGGSDEFQMSATTMHQSVAEGRYGRIMNRNGIGNSASTNNDIPTHHTTNNGLNNYQMQTHDRYNANVQFHHVNGIENNCANNNPTVQLHHVAKGGNGSYPKCMSPTPLVMSNGMMAPNGIKTGPAAASGTPTAVIIRSHNKDGLNGNGMLRGHATHHRLSNGHLTAPGSHPLAHVIGSLSSPESAYSTGYSTDGTSPGATNTPEYYINMRTGTHYFPRGVNGVAAVERNRQKFGLNKIEESAIESTMLVVNQNTTTSSSSSSSTHRRTESCDLSRRLPNMRTINQIGHLDNGGVNAKDAQQAGYVLSRGVSPDLHRRLAYQSYKGMESPSPRQRSRIRTNPWFTSVDATASNTCINGAVSKKMDIDTSSTSSGVKSGTDERNHKNKNQISSESESSSTEVESSKRILTPNTINRRRADKQISEILRRDATVESDDEDATFNEMMGKFDESYIYEKETDILSDSDPTECNSDLDTGLDGGDECDTDELLDIDYIDTGSMQEVVENHIYQNTGSCTYHSFQMDKKLPKLRRSRKQQSDEGSRRKKKLTRRKRSTDCRDSSQNSQKTDSPNRSRESRSLGGTPVSLRRNPNASGKRSPKMAPLANRCNSLTFTEIHSVRSRYLAIAESEKALLKADIEADVKYKQLIHEAETILVTMKTTALRETPVPSPRRVCNVPANKRVEMLRNCEADLRRELSKAQKHSDTSPDPHHGPPLKALPADINPHIKRVEELRHETTSVPSSPKSARFSPRKTHVSNFINQYTNANELVRRRSSPEPIRPQDTPNIQLNGVQLSPPKSPKLSRRRFRSQSPRVCIDESETDSDHENKNVAAVRRAVSSHAKNEINGNVEKVCGKGNVEKAIKKIHHRARTQMNDDVANQNVTGTGEHAGKSEMLSFNSVAKQFPENSYCPQSEPLKRKIYSEKTLDRLQRSLEMESEIPKKALLQKISLLRLERQAAKAQNESGTSTTERLSSTIYPMTEPNSANGNVQSITKRQLILNTIEDLKRSLEDQSIELCGLNENE